MKAIWNRRFAVLFVTLVAGTRSLAAPTAGDKQGDVWAVIDENDLFSLNNSDRHYTQGMKFIWLSAEDRLPGWADRMIAVLPPVGLETNAHRLGFTFGQNMYTPRSLSLVRPDPTDRPYAGWLYGGMVLQRRGTSFQDVPVFENLELDLGIVGPQSLADSAQATIHRWEHGIIPAGWNQQLQTEPALLLRYGRFWRVTPCAATTNWFDVLPYTGGMLGNVQISAAAGALARLGWNLPQDFGPQTIDGLGTLNGGLAEHSQPCAFYFFGGLEGRAVAHDLFLDGNSFRSGPAVERNPWVADLRFGTTFRLWRHLEFSYIHSIRTSQFVGQHGNDFFGSLLANAEWDW